MWQTFLERTGFPAKAGYQTAALRLENRDALKTDLDDVYKRQGRSAGGRLR